MNDFLQELDEESKDDPYYQQLSREEKLHIIGVLEKMIDMGMTAVYEDEASDEPTRC